MEKSARSTAEGLGLGSLPIGWKWLRWRGLLLVSTFGMALVAFRAGVGVSDREVAGLGTQVYYSLGLFVFGGMDLGTPKGGPTWARDLLWAAYFLAPIITTSAIIEGIVRAVRPRALRMRLMRNHVIVVGFGRLAMLYLHCLRENDRKQRVVVVEKDPSKAGLHVAAHRYRAEIVHGDITHEGVLESLRLDRAASVVLLTGDDFVNLDTASRISTLAPDLVGRILVHVADIRMRRTLEAAGGLGQLMIFNSHETAARHLVHAKLLPWFQRTEERDLVVLAGFGRFGQTVLDELQVHAPTAIGPVIIVDLEANLRARVFSEQVGFVEGLSHEVQERDMRDPGTWQEIQEAHGEAVRTMSVILGTDEAGVNIRTAVALASRYPEAHVVARCFYPSAFTQQISQQYDFEIVSSAELLLTSLDPRWFAKD